MLASVQSHPVAPIIIYTNNASLLLQGFSKQRLFLKIYGYRAFCGTDDNAFAHNGDKEFQWHSLAPSQVNVNPTSTNLETLLDHIKQRIGLELSARLDQLAKQYQGGLVVILDDSYRSLIKELPFTSIAFQMQSADSEKELHQSMSGLSLSIETITLDNIQSPLRKAIRQHLKTHSPTMTYREALTPQVLNQLHRVHPDFSVYQNEETQQLDAVLPNKNMDEFEKAALRVYQKLGVVSHFVQSEQPLLVISDIHGPNLEKINNLREEFPINWGAFIALKSACLHLKEIQTDQKPLINLKASIVKMTLSLPGGFEIQVGALQLIQLTLFCQGANAYVLAKTLKRDLIGYFLDEKQVQHFTVCMEKAGAVVERAFENQGKPRVLPWHKKLAKDIYQEHERSFYAQMPHLMASLFIQSLYANASLLVRAKSNGVHVFALGCGDGNELTNFREACTQEGVAMKGLGLDINPSNFKEQTNNIQLVAADAKDLKYWVAPHEKSSSLKVAIFNGFLIPQVLSGTQQATHVLQQTRCFDVVYISGSQSVLITQSMAKAMGYDVKTVSELYVLTKSNNERRKNYLSKRAVKRSSRKLLDCLDLSLSADPLRDTQLFDNGELSLLKQVDLSWTYMEVEEFKQLFERLAGLNITNLKIIISGEEQWLDYFSLLTLGTSFELIQRKDFCREEVNAFAPGESKALKIYKSLPYEVPGVDYLKRKAKENIEETYNWLQAFLKLLTPITEQDKVLTSRLSYSVATLKWPKGHRIKQMRLFSPHINAENPLTHELKDLLGDTAAEGSILPDFEKIRLMVTYNDGKKEVYKFPRPHLSIDVRVKLSTYGYTEELLSRLPEECKMDWRDDLATNFYIPANVIVPFYQNHHRRYIPPKLFCALAANQQWLITARLHGVNLFSIGCAAGDELSFTQSYFRNKGLQCRAVGIDINPRNFPKQTDITYIEGDMRQLQTLIAPYCNNASLKIGMFIGSLARQCLSNGMIEALDVLQQAKDMDLMMLSGATDPVMTTWVAKGIGWKTKGCSISKDMEEDGSKKSPIMRYNVFMLYKMTDQERKQYLLKRGIKRTRAKQFHCLDLSFSASPLRDISLFTYEDLKSIKQIDLSWTKMSDIEATSLFATITRLAIPSLKIIVSSKESWLTKVESLKNFECFIREDHLPDEIPFISPSNARLLGIYEQLPVKKLTR